MGDFLQGSAVVLAAIVGLGWGAHDRTRARTYGSGTGLNGHGPWQRASLRSRKQFPLLWQKCANSAFLISGHSEVMGSGLTPIAA